MNFFRSIFGCCFPSHNVGADNHRRVKRILPDEATLAMSNLFAMTAQRTKSHNCCWIRAAKS